MDGFNVISVGKDSNQNNPSLGNTPFGTTAPIVLDGVEIIDEEKEKQKSKPSGYESWFFFVAVFSLVLSICYFIFLVVYRITLVDQIIAYDEQLKAREKNIDIKEIQELRAMDEILKSINGRLKNHVSLSSTMSFINSNIRKTLQVSDYRLQVNQKDVRVDFSAVAPSFKEFAEQTEKLYSLKESKSIESFAITGLSFEPSTRRLKFTTQITFDRAKISVNPNAERKLPEDNTAPLVN